MADEILKIDANHKSVLGAVTDDANQFIKMGRIDDATKGLKVMLVGGTGAGTVTSITQGTGILLTPSPITTTGSVALATSLQPMATLTGKALQFLRVNAGETAVEYAAAGSGTVTSVSVTTANGVSGSVATATTTPAITLTLGAVTPTTVNGLTITANGTNTLNIAAGKTLVVSNSITLAGTDSTVMTFPTTSATIARTDAGQTFTGVSNATSWNFTTPVLGTPTSGTLTNCTGLPAASIVPGTLATGTYLLSENASIALDPAGSADGKYTGITMTATGGATIAFGDLLYLDAATSRWKLTDADASATAGPVMLAMAVSSSTDGTAVTLLLQGNIRADAKFPALTIGAPAYVGETAGTIQVAIPTGADNIIRVVGFALTADEIYFNPSQDHQVTVA